MNFNKHSKLEGTHAFLSASKYHWLNYDDQKLRESFYNHNAALRGTELHDFARRCIELGQRLPRNNNTLNMFVNDAIGFKMTPEVTLYYSDNCYGTTDAIAFRKNILRIHDYKSGTTPASMSQLLIYNALFCFEYHVNPEEINTELRIYQNNEIIPHRPDPEEVRFIMDRIITSDKIIESMKGGELLE